ncbi:hypothetical protein PM082_017817 [Marasmius tenuissimus]|nr:hypothetical protein PM082_017817 [Marasmius tenuissimus]
MIFYPKNSREEVLTSSTAWLPLAYDTVVLALTLYRALSSFREAPLSRPIMKQLLEDGVIYYGVILAITIVLTVMMRVAEDGLKNITAQLHLLLTVTMMSRITLNLKKCRFASTAESLNPKFSRPSTTFYRRSDESQAVGAVATHGEIHALSALPHHYSRT